MKAASLFIIAIFSLVSSSAQNKTTPVFISGTEGHKSYRIPAIVSLPNGELLAFAEGRVNNAGDFGDINIVLKRSGDGGGGRAGVSRGIGSRDRRRELRGGVASLLPLDTSLSTHFNCVVAG